VIRVRDISIRWILVTVILSTSMGILAVGGLLLARRELHDLQDDQVRVSLQTARTVGEYCVAEVAFGDRDESARTLQNLRQDPTVLSVALYDAKGALFAAWDRQPGDADAGHPPSLEWPPDAPEVRPRDGLLEVLHPLVFKDERYGTIRLVSSTAVVERRIARYRWTTVATFGALACVAFLFTLLVQRIVSRPILRLADTAERLSAAEDWSARFPSSGPREMWVLTAAFNRLLAAIEQRERQRDLAEAAQQRYAEGLSVLREVDRAILRGWGVDRIARLALGGLQRVAGTSPGAVLTFDDPPGTVRVLTVLPDEAVTTGEARDWPLDLSDPALRERLETGVAFTVGAGGDLPDLPSWIPPSLAGGRGILQVYPLRIEHTLLGCLALRMAGPVRPDLSDVQTAHEVASLLAVALQQARLTRAVESHTRELEQRVRERTAQLEASNRQLEAFGYSVAHDLRAPLRTIGSFSGVLREDYEAVLDDAGKDLLRRIGAATERMDALIRDLLDYSRLGAQEIRLGAVDLDEVMEAVRHHLSALLAEREAALAVEGPLGRVIGHPTLLQQALENLVSNAVKFVAAGTPPRVQVRSEARDGRLRIWVEDNGIGIAPEHQERIFRLFERLHPSGVYPGTGVGLAIVQRAAERLGGTAGVVSEAGHGARFFIEVPAAD
jgi:signal transduction histidine kinase